MVTKEAPVQNTGFASVYEIQAVPSIFETTTESIRPDKIIVVQIATLDWTLRALEQACPVALAINAEIVLLDMIPVQHLGWLGTDFGWAHSSGANGDQYVEYTDSVKIFGIPVSIQRFQYSTLSEALVQASEYLHADIVFATLPAGIAPLLHEIRIRWLQRRLTRQGCQLAAVL